MKPPLQHSAALFVRVRPVFQEEGCFFAKKPKRLHCSIAVYKSQLLQGVRMLLIRMCLSPAALLSGWLCGTPSSSHKVCESPQPAAMSQLFHLHRGAPPYWQLPPPQDHWEGKLCQGEAGTTCPDWTGGERSSSCLGFTVLSIHNSFLTSKLTLLTSLGFFFYMIAIRAATFIPLSLLMCLLNILVINQ